jgi:hypothetical protein
MNNSIKVIITVCLFSINTLNINAQNKENTANDLGRIVLNEYVSDDVERIPISAKIMMLNKLGQITTENGMGGSALVPRFIITPSISVISKDLLETAPPMTVLTLEVTFYIGDGIEGIQFASESIQVKGVGTNQTKAYLSALKQIKPSNPSIQNFVDRGKNKIIEFFNQRCDLIIKEAQILEKQNEFEAAIFILTSVPEVCEDCFNKSMDIIGPIYQKQIDKEGNINLFNAKNVWNSGQDFTSAGIASEYLADIDPNAACYNEAVQLSEMIYKRIKEIDQREWNFELKQQQEEVDSQKAMIEAAREIGTAYGNNQKETINYNISDWWKNPYSNEKTKL